MDTIKLKRSIQSDYTARYYTMTGGEFKAMLEAVKALPFRQYDGSEKVWIVKKDGIEALQGQGFAITQDPDLKQDFFESSITDLRDRVHVYFYSFFRDDKQHFSSLPPRRIYFSITDEEIEAEQARIDEAVKRLNLSVTFSPAGRYQAIREMARRKCNEYFGEVLKIYEAVADDKRDKESNLAGLKAVVEVLQNEKH